MHKAIGWWPRTEEFSPSVTHGSTALPETRRPPATRSGSSPRSTARVTGSSPHPEPSPNTATPRPDFRHSPADSFNHVRRALSLPFHGAGSLSRPRTLGAFGRGHRRTND